MLASLQGVILVMIISFKMINNLFVW